MCLNSEGLTCLNAAFSSREDDGFVFRHFFATWTFSADFGKTLSAACQDLNFEEKDFSPDNKTVNVQTWFSSGMPGCSLLSYCCPHEMIIIDYSKTYWVQHKRLFFSFDRHLMVTEAWNVRPDETNLIKRCINLWSKLQMLSLMFFSC